MFFGMYKVNIYIFIYREIFKVCFFNAVISFYRPAFIKGRIISRHYHGIPHFIILRYRKRRYIKSGKDLIILYKSINFLNLLTFLYIII